MSNINYPRLSTSELQTLAEKDDQWASGALSLRKITVTPKGVVLENHKINGFQYFTCPNQ